MRRLFALALLLCFSVAVTAASTFKLANMPEKFATIEGAILERDAESITIMTQDNVMIRSLDSIEILEETPEADQAFIEEYGPNNPAYQRYLDQENPQSAAPAVSETDNENGIGYPSIAEAGKQYTLRYQHEKNRLYFLQTTMNLTMNIDMGERKMNTDMKMDSLAQLFSTNVNQAGVGTYRAELERFDMQMKMGDRWRSAPIPNDQSPEGTQYAFEVSPNGSITGLDESPNPMLPLSQNPLQMENNFVNLLFLPYPQEPMAVGHTWPIDASEIADALPEGLTLNQSATFVDVVDMQDTPAIVLDLITSMNAENLEIDPSQFQQNAQVPDDAENLKIDQLRLNQTQRYFIELETGFPIQIEETMKSTSTMTTGQAGIVIKNGWSSEGTHVVSEQRPGR